VLAAAHGGWGSLIGQGGSYACASAKEEFGLAIVEALAAGLPVTAPLAGGPATYVDPDRTGILVDTTEVTSLAQAVEATLVLAADPDIATRTRAAIEGRYTLERMARSLTAVYRVTTGAASLAATVVSTAQDAA
jgi:glycosyltransferase involved in cell wall biosynthesis